MPCFDPRQGYRARTVNPTGKRSIVFNLSEGFKDLPVTIPCGQCIGCRLERSRVWATRLHHESQLYEDNSFITLTYSDENLPKNGSLDKTHFQKFTKRLRKHFSDRKIRFYGCGEYGDKFQRPHYHFCLFNLDFPDKIHEKTHNDQKYYSSKILDKIWGNGRTLIGNLTFESAAYVARYILKKQTGERARWYYDEIDPDTGEILREMQPEFAHGSNRPGLGKGWFDKYKNTDLFPHDFVVIRGKKARVPKYYNHHFEIAYPSDYAKIKAERQVQSAKHAENNTVDRLKVREEIQYLKAQQLKRNYEHG